MLDYCDYEICKPVTVMGKNWFDESHMESLPTPEEL